MSVAVTLDVNSGSAFKLIVDPVAVNSVVSKVHGSLSALFAVDKRSLELVRFVSSLVNTLAGLFILERALEVRIIAVRNFAAAVPSYAFVFVVAGFAGHDIVRGKLNLHLSRSIYL